MLGKKQFHVDLAGFADPRGVCENLHAFLNLVVAGGNEMVDSLHFYNADTAGTDLVDIFQIAKIRNVKTIVAAGVQNPGSFWNLQWYIINFDGYKIRISHDVVRPPLKFP